MKRESFFGVRNYFWFWSSLAVVLACIASYLILTPKGGHSGGSPLGYTLGVLSTIGIVYLMWYGIRKRDYYATRTTLKAVLSSHIWIGLALVFIVPLHSGFQFGMNVHTLAYVLMCLTVLTGVIGVVLFRIYPKELHSQRGGANTAQLLSSLFAINSEIEDQLNAASVSGAESDLLLKLAHKHNPEFHASLFSCLFSSALPTVSEEALALGVNQMPALMQRQAFSLLSLIQKKRKLVSQIQNEVRAQTLIRGWLYFHVPLSFALCVALFVHIISVFYYW